RSSSPTDLEDRQRGLLDGAAKEAVRTSSHYAQESDLHAPTMRADHAPTRRVALHQLVQAPTNPLLKVPRPLTTRHDVPVGLLEPRLPLLWIALGDLSPRQTFPLAQRDFSQFGNALRSAAEPLSDRSRCV